MPTISAIQTRLRSVNVLQVASESIDECRDIIKSEQINQLKRGERKSGKKIGKYKSTKYAQQKFAQNPLAGFGNVDEVLTGDYSSDIFVDARAQTFVIESGDVKAGDLFKKYGETLGLGKKARTNVINLGLRSTFNRKIKEATGL